MAETAQELFDALCEPFPLEYIEWRIGSTNSEKTKGLPLCYIDARAVMDRLDTVCGPDGWQCNYSPAPGNAIICNIGIRVRPESVFQSAMASTSGLQTVVREATWIWKADGAGATDVEGEKGMLSDALKRAAVRWGVGRYLYDLKSPWVAIEPMGRSYKIAESEKKKLDDLHEDFAQKCGWGLRAGIQAYKLLNAALKHWVPDAISAQQFREENKSMIVQLPVGMRKHFNETIDRIGANGREAAE